MNPAPPKPPSKNANRKALAAYFSELRRWAEALRRWEADLDERETAFEKAVDEADDNTVQRYANGVTVGADWSAGHDRSVSYTATEEDEDCDCGDEEATAGCSCPKCRKIMAQWYSANDPVPPAGDEIEWLEKLWKLRDERK